VQICTIYWAWEDFWFSFSKFCKIGKAKPILPMLYLYFKIRNYALVSKRLFFFPLKQEKEERKTLLMKY
jgi:hypothetical protein